MLEIFFGYGKVPQGGCQARNFELRSQRGQRSNRCIFLHKIAIRYFKLLYKKYIFQSNNALYGENQRPDMYMSKRIVFGMF